jgi:glutathione peroxidase
VTNAYDFDVEANDGRRMSLGDYRGQVLLIVNTASQCGFTPQYRGLEELYREYRDRGFSVLAFPCNQFGGQEPGDADEIRNFCSTNFDLSLPIFAKIDVNGPAAHPLYQWLKRERRGFLGSERIRWNFTKFLVDRTGRAIGRFAPQTQPDKLKAAIERLL